MVFIVYKDNTVRNNNVLGVFSTREKAVEAIEAYAHENAYGNQAVIDDMRTECEDEEELQEDLLDMKNEFISSCEIKEHVDIDVIDVKGTLERYYKIN